MTLRDTLRAEERATWAALVEMARDHAAEPTSTTARLLGAAGRRAYKTPIPEPRTPHRNDAFRALAFAAKEGIEADFEALANEVAQMLDDAPAAPQPFYLRD